MKKYIIILSSIIITIIFLYGLKIISDKNECTGVRSYSCLKEKGTITSSKQDKNYNYLLEKSSSFTKLCKPKIQLIDSIYKVSYDNCDIKVFFDKTGLIIKDVENDGVKLSAQEIINIMK